MSSVAYARPAPDETLSTPNIALADTSDSSYDGPFSAISSASGNRDRWSSRPAFLFAAIGSAVGIGNLWRFPYLSFHYGGGAFFIPYLLALLFVGIPILQLEFSLGQAFQGGNGVVFSALWKRAIGLGVAGPVTAFIAVVYYSTILSWSLVYVVFSFKAKLPWYLKNQETYLCPNVGDSVLCDRMATCNWNELTKLCQASVLKQAETFFLHVLNITKSTASAVSLTGSGYVIGGLVAVWAMIFLAMFKGAKLLSKVMYVTMAAPVILLIIITARSAMLDGAAMGIRQYIVEWDLRILLNDPSVWCAAVGQVFFSLSLCYGQMTAYASYNKRHQNVVQDSFIVAFSNSAFSVVAGLAVFAVAGYLAKSSSVPLSSLHKAGVGLAFWTFPTALAQLGTPAAQLFSVLFFLMFFLLGIMSAISMVESLLALLIDSSLISKNRRRLAAIIPVCIIGLLTGLIFSSNIGSHLIKAVDYYLINTSAVFLGLCQCLVVGWMQGMDIQAQRIGWPAVALFFTSVIGGATLGSAVGLSFKGVHDWTFNQPAGLILGPVFGLSFAAIGFAFSFFLANNVQLVDASSTHGMKQSKAWWLLIGNIESLRRDLNNTVSSSKRQWLPFMSSLTIVWSITVKYLIPVVLIIMLGAHFSSGKFGAYDSLPIKYQITGITLAAMPFLIALLGLVLPSAFQKFSREVDKVPTVASPESTDLKITTRSPIGSPEVPPSSMCDGIGPHC